MLAVFEQPSATSDARSFRSPSELEGDGRTDRRSWTIGPYFSGHGRRVGCTAVPSIKTGMRTC
jgi:hypothetical protein